jgi:hypothetical protein
LGVSFGKGQSGDNARSLITIKIVIKRTDFNRMGLLTTKVRGHFRPAVLHKDSDLHRSLALG